MRICSGGKTQGLLETGVHRGLFLLLLLTAIAAAQAQDFTYTNTNGTITITQYNGPGGNVTVPPTIDGLPVTTIANNVFLNLTNLTSITLPQSLASIGDW